MIHSMTLPCLNILVSSSTGGEDRRAKKTKVKQRKSGKGFAAERKKEGSWQCVEGCGACCKLDKGPAFATPDEIFQNPSDIQLYKSMTGPDGWCINYEKETHKCSIYPDRPYFCRVEADVFESLYGINKNKFNREACSCCQDTIKAIYGCHSNQLHNFNQAINTSTPSSLTGNQVKSES